MGGIRLVKATIKKFYDFCARQRQLGEDGYELHDRRFSIRYETNIPRQVGLAGSSAIIVATLRTLMEFYQVIAGKDSSRLAQLMNDNFDARQRMFTIEGNCFLPANHVEMIHAARRAGASAKFAGSGGAIIGTYDKETGFQQLCHALKKLNCQVIKPIVE